ncbi:hypothetical protein GCM10011514_52380 [Emticicia aquatilis]|uniref:Beta-propeller repeat protein n=1 Tax=Emticicia aquatilis TaxID=1537369 RepID=A0A917DYC3_9BACT|nr:SBBP repeat-containing protein [Emticicia aquatilis]GGD81830.1 hypothetical protein GCM10011514_52380 [Emticicia aquatilis]
MKKLFSIFILLFYQNVCSQTLNWVKQIGSPTRANYGYAIVADASGNTYVTGNFTGTADFGGTVLTAFFQDIFVAKYNSSGTLQWVRQAGRAGAFNTGKGIAIDGSGNVYVTGYITADTDFIAPNITITLNRIGSNDLFIAKYANDGSLQWVKQAGATSKYVNGNAIAVNGSGNIYVTGYFEGTVDFGGTSLTASTNRKDIFVASYNSSGTLVWVKQGGSTSSGNNSFGITADASGNIFVTGVVTGTGNFAGTNFSFVGSDYMFMANFNTIGSLQWVKFYGKPAVFINGIYYGYSVEGRAISTDNNGNFFVAGRFATDINFDGITLTPTTTSSNNIFILKYNSLGNISWANQMCATGTINLGVGIASDASSNCYVTGTFGGSGNFSGSTYTSVGTQDAFVSKYDNAGTLKWVKTAGATNKFASGYGISIANANVYTTGFFSGTTNFGGTTLGLIGNQDAYVWVLQQTTCQSTLSPTGTITSNQKAAASVTSLGTNTIPNASNVIYQGGNFVQLNAGFSAVSGSVFTAKILGGCL